MDVRTQTVNITTSTAGAFTQTIASPGPLFLHAVYAAGGGLSTTADLTITDSLTGMVLLSAANFASTAQTTWTPRRLINDAANGVASTTVYDYQAVNQKVDVAIAQGGASKAGDLHLVFG